MHIQTNDDDHADTHSVHHHSDDNNNVDGGDEAVSQTSSFGKHGQIIDNEVTESDLVHHSSSQAPQAERGQEEDSIVAPHYDAVGDNARGDEDSQQDESLWKFLNTELSVS